MERNKLANENCTWDTIKQVEFANSFLVEFLSAKHGQKVKITKVDDHPEKWCPLTVEKLNMDIDASIRVRGSFSGIGIVF